MKKRQVRVEKIDPDTIGAAFLLGVSREDEVVVLRGEASSEDLENAEVICIEVGGSGQSQLNNWDHHGPGSEGLFSATFQVWLEMGANLSEKYKELVTRIGVFGLCTSSPCAFSFLVDYINKLDTRGPKALGEKSEELSPTLSDVFSGMLLTERDPVEQLHKGVRMLREVIMAGIDAFGQMPESMVSGPWSAYVEAKAENNRQIAKAVENAQWSTTSAGFRMAWLETDFFGAPGALYGVGAQVVVAFAPHFGPAKVRKFTVAGNSIKVDAVLPKLNALESGWGGPPTGTIIGSPREGSELELSEVVKIVEETL